MHTYTEYLIRSCFGYTFVFNLGKTGESTASVAQQQQQKEEEKKTRLKTREVNVRFWCQLLLKNEKELLKYTHLSHRVKTSLENPDICQQISAR